MKTIKFLSILFAAIVINSSFYACKDKAADEPVVETLVAEEQEVEENTIMVGGAEMYPSKNIVENASQSQDHTTLVAAVVAADLAETLSSAGPFTVFAPTNAAFEALPKGTVETLLKPENKATLQGILTYHVIAGNINAASVLDMIANANGTAKAKTVAGGELTFTTENGNVYITDAAGNKAQVTQADVAQSNGVIHVIDKVLLPTK